MFKKLVALLLCITVLFGISVTFAAGENEKEILPSTWAAVDGLGRTLSLNEKVGNKREDKIVAMFY